MCHSLASKFSTYLIILLLSYSPFALGQAYKPLRQAISMEGQTFMVNLAGRDFYVQQSIGQASVIGRFSNGSHIARQGFIQPVSKQLASRKQVDETFLNTATWPNPFADRITIEVHDDVQGPILASLRDVMGRTWRSLRLINGQAVDMETLGLPSGIYFLTVTCGSKYNTHKVIKR